MSNNSDAPEAGIDASPVTGNAIALLGILLGGFSIWATEWSEVFKAAATLFLIGAVLLAANAQDKDRTERLADWLEGGGFGWAYRSVVEGWLEKIWAIYCRPVAEDASVSTIFRAAFTWRVVELALFLAVLYPFASIFVVWLATGTEAWIGNAQMLPPMEHWSSLHLVNLTLTVLCAIAISRFLLAGDIDAFDDDLRELQRADWAIFGFPVAAVVMLYLELLPYGALVLYVNSFLVAGFRAGGMRGIGLNYSPISVFVAAICIAISYPFARFFFDSTILWLIGNGLGILFVLGSLFLVQRIRSSGFGRQATLISILASLAGLAITAFVVPWENLSGWNRSVFVFLALFPVVNGLFDALSYAITVTLVRLGLRSQLVPAIFFGLLDVVIGAALFFALGTALVFVAAGLNALADYPILNITWLLARAANGPSADTAWIYLMVFSTLVPTLAHLVLTLLSLERLMLPGCSKFFANLVRSGRKRGLESILAPAAGGLALTIPFLALYGLGWVIWTYGEATLKRYGEVYIDWLFYLAFVIESL